MCCWKTWRRRQDRYYIYKDLRPKNKTYWIPKKNFDLGEKLIVRENRGSTARWISKKHFTLPRIGVNWIHFHIQLLHSLNEHDVVSVLDSCRKDHQDTATMDSVLYCRVCMTYNHPSLNCAQMKDRKAFIWTRSRNFHHWWQQHDGYNSSSSVEEVGSRHKFKWEDRLCQPPEQKQWRQNKQPRSAYRGKHLELSTIHGWNKASRSGLPPPKPSSSTN